MRKPNLFEFATKELSQDAFISWLLSWADKKYHEDELHELGLSLVRSLLAKFKLESIQINSIELKQQFKKIDILVLINTHLKELKSKPTQKNAYVIIIEDKVGAGLTGNQLERYFEIVKNLGMKESQILPIYLRTKDKLDTTGIVKKNYMPYMRGDLLAVLKDYQGTNQIITDFRSYWQPIEDDTNRYQETKEVDWNNQSWIGFYKSLRDDLEQGSNSNKNLFNTKSSPTYGPLFEQDKVDHQIFIKLCKRQLFFTIQVQDKNNNALINQLRKKWLAKLVGNNIDSLGVIKKALRVGRGKVMTIGFIDNYIVLNNGYVDIKQTLRNLRLIESFLLNLD